MPDEVVPFHQLPITGIEPQPFRFHLGLGGDEHPAWAGRPFARTEAATQRIGWADAYWLLEHPEHGWVIVRSVMNAHVFAQVASKEEGNRVIDDLLSKRRYDVIPDEYLVD
ncbi:hypothetical protein [Saccharothrix sp. ST-888]|uniref:hypothetical protein n=1 Tax=Saccharothrix sp. ST-888 TaxID=1427391 RepID=UPI0005EC48F3|nr:hypothetical protein [Saccharothrix sp. ST-888]KJK56242.1 hypothetical protein UK12_23965 [Saccharothrix sp. ST-888]